MKFTEFWFIILTVFISSCSSGASDYPTVSTEKWGEKDGKEIKHFTLINKNGMVVRVTNYGGTLTYVSVPDRNGINGPVILGFDSLNKYLERHPNFGSTVGRFANRIGGAEFTLYGETYKLTANNRGNTLHGGTNGFSKQVFDIDTSYVSHDSAFVIMNYLSPDMEEGFPGTLTFQLTYILTGENEIILGYEATTDKPTVINFTNHTYFNLSGCKESVLNHILKITADSICQVDSIGIPTGSILPVTGTAYDFTVARKVGDRIGEVGPGYDINYKLRKEGDELFHVAEVFEPMSGRVLDAYTTEPGMQLFSANNDLSRFTGHDGIRYGRHYGLCLEMQHFPDSPNKPNFPDVVLKPGEIYRQLTIYKFSLRP